MTLSYKKDFIYALQKKRKNYLQATIGRTQMSIFRTGETRHEEIPLLTLEKAAHATTLFLAMNQEELLLLPAKMLGKQKNRKQSLTSH